MNGAEETVDIETCRSTVIDSIIEKRKLCRNKLLPLRAYTTILLQLLRDWGLHLNCTGANSGD